MGQGFGGGWELQLKGKKVTFQESLGGGDFELDCLRTLTRNHRLDREKKSMLENNKSQVLEAKNAFPFFFTTFESSFLK